MSFRKKQLEIYEDLLIPLLKENEFQLISEIDDNINDDRYITRHQFRRRTPDEGRDRMSLIDIVGIPMGSAILLIHAIICDSSGDFVKIKIKMSDTINSIKEKLINDFVNKLIEMHSISINDLPLELKFCIMSLLPIETLFKMALVSTLWRDIALDDELWRIMVKKQFPAFYSRGIDGLYN
jgi:hypothetical protein